MSFGAALTLTCSIRKKPPTEAALLFRQLLFDVGVHSLSEGTLNSDDSIVLGKNVLLEEPETAFTGLGWGDLQIFVDGPFSQGNAVWVSFGDQPAQNS